METQCLKVFGHFLMMSPQSLPPINSAKFIAVEYCHLLETIIFFFFATFRVPWSSSYLPSVPLCSLATVSTPMVIPSASFSLSSLASASPATPYATKMEISIRFLPCGSLRRVLLTHHSSFLSGCPLSPQNWDAPNWTHFLPQTKSSF